MKPTVGEQLRSTRESRGLTIEDAIKATNIRRAYLQELESDHPERLHSAAQARGFLRLYASYLGIPSASLIVAWDQPAVEEPTAASQDEETPETSPDGASAEDEPTSTGSETDPPSTKDGAEKESAGSLIKDALQRIPKLSQFFARTTSKGEKVAERAVKKEDRERDRQERAVAQPPPAPLRPARDIMADIGRALQERREALELTLSDAETFTNVKRMYLEALETGEFNELPSTVQGRGMLNNYSHFLGLDESWVMDAYAKALLSARAEMDTKPRKAQPPLTVRLNIPEKWRRYLNPDLIIGGIFIVALFGFILWGGMRVFSNTEPTATEAPSISEMLAQTPTATSATNLAPEEDGDAAPEATAIPGVAIVEVTPTIAPTVNAAPLQLYIIVSDRAYLQIEVDGEEQFNGRVEPDDVFTFSGQETISLLTGNGAALEVYFNQEFLGNLGDVGEVADISFSLQGLSTATPAPTETPEPDQPPAEEDAMDAMEEAG